MSNKRSAYRLAAALIAGKRCGEVLTMQSIKAELVAQGAAPRIRWRSIGVAVQFSIERGLISDQGKGRYMRSAAAAPFPCSGCDAGSTRPKELGRAGITVDRQTTKQSVGAKET